MKKIAYYLLPIIITNCSLIDPLLGATPDNVKNWTDKQIYLAQASSIKPHPDSIGARNKRILRQEMINRHPEWAEDIRAAVLDGNLIVGMTEEQVLASWGEPKARNRTTTKDTVEEQWIYTVPQDIGPSYYSINYNEPVSFAYIENGKLKSFQD